MRREGEIKQKYKQIKFRLKKDAIRKSLEKIPSNCINNQTHSCGNKKIGLCGLSWFDREWDTVICDDETEEGVKRALSCPNFSPWKSIDQTKQEFDSIVRSAKDDIGVMAYYYPDLAALFWVLDEPDDGQDNVNECEEEGTKKESDNEDPEMVDEFIGENTEFRLFTNSEFTAMKIANWGVIVTVTLFLVIFLYNLIS